jgi:hypothetical protein
MFDDSLGDPADEDTHEAGMSESEALDRGLTMVRAIYNAGQRSQGTANHVRGGQV